MSTSLRLFAIAGSIRSGSFNQSLLAAAIDAAKESGAEVTMASRTDLDLPMFNQDLESNAGLPDKVKALKKRLLEADGLLVASPEYNSSITPMLKNAIDWCSRSETDDEPSLAAYRGKSALLLSASPGALGGLRGLFHVRDIFQNIGVTVFPKMHSVSSAYEKINDKGEFTDAKEKARVIALVKDYVKFAISLKG